MSLAALIAAQRVDHGIPVALSCRALGVSQGLVSQVAQRRSVTTSETADGAGGDDRLPVRSTQRDVRITADLRALGWRVSGNTVAKLLAEQGLVARRKR